MFSTPRTSIRNHFSASGRSAAITKSRGELGVEAVLVDDVVAGRAGGARKASRCASCPSQSCAERRPARRAGWPPASRRRGSRPSGSRSSVVAGGRGAAPDPGREGRHRTGRRGLRGAGRPQRSCLTRRRLPPWRSRHPPTRLRAAADGRCLPVPRPGRPRVPMRDDRRRHPRRRLLARSSASVEQRGEVGEGLGAWCRSARSRARCASAWCRRRARRSASPAARARSRRAGPSAAASRRRRRRSRASAPTAGRRRRSAWRQQQHPVTGDVEGAGDVGRARRAAARRSRSSSCRNCSRGSKPSTRRDHRQPEVRRHRAGHVRPDHVGAAQHGDPDVGAAAGEAADVALDLEGVLGVAGPGQPLGGHVLGEHRGVAAARAVDRRCWTSPPGGAARAPAGRRRAAAWSR